MYAFIFSDITRFGLLDLLFLGAAFRGAARFVTRFLGADLRLRGAAERRLAICSSIVPTRRTFNGGRLDGDGHSVYACGQYPECRSGPGLSAKA